jgi:hypothetical protein
MMPIEVPLSAIPAQKFVTQLGLRRLAFDVQWNDRTQLFSLTLSDDETGQVYFAGVPLVLGASLLEPYNYAMGDLMMYESAQRGAEATLDDLGDRVKLYWFSEQEVADVTSI